jgi:enoyl-CoA hydratase
MIEHTSLGNCALLRLAHGKAQALDLDLVRALVTTLDEVEASPARAVVLTGSGTIFSAGVDLRQLLDRGPEYIDTFVPAMCASFERLFFFPRPVVAAVNGHAVAGGCILTCACDHRIMARGKGRIGAAELKVGVPFPMIPLEILRFAIPMPHLQTVALGADTYLPDDALRLGIVDEVVDDARLLVRAQEIAEGLGAVPADSFRRAKESLRRPVREALDRHAARVDASVMAAWRSDEVRGAVRAYVTKTLGAK